MVSTTEVRRHNLIFLSSDKSIQSINTIYCNSFCLMGFDKTVWCNEVEPIPLTEDVLVKAGFNKYDDIFFWQPEFENIHYRLKQFSMEREHYSLSKGFINYDHDLCSVSNLHSLQNIIYFLTGEELEVKL